MKVLFRIKLKWISFINVGNDIECLVCGWKGKNYYQNKCPNCLSIPKSRLVPFSLVFFNIKPKIDSFLHISPSLKEMRSIRRSLAVEKYETLDRKNHPFVTLRKDLVDEFDEINKYDLVLAWHIFEHVENDRKAIRNVYKSMKPNGIFIVSVPIYPQGREETYENIEIKRQDYIKVHGHSEHCRSCGLDYYNRFLEVGFKKRELLVKNLDEAVYEKFGLSKNHVIWEFTK